MCVHILMGKLFFLAGKAGSLETLHAIQQPRWQSLMLILSQPKLLAEDCSQGYLFVLVFLLTVKRLKWLSIKTIKKTKNKTQNLYSSVKTLSDHRHSSNTWCLSAAPNRESSFNHVLLLLLLRLLEILLGHR